MSTYQMQTVPYGTTYAAPVYQDEQLNQGISKLAATSLALAEHTALQGQLYAALTKQVMSNTAALAMSEDYFCQVAPRGSEEYRLIVETYAKLALKYVWTGGER